MNKKSSVRLASHIFPTKYQITVKPDLEAFIFEGEETIDLILQKPSKNITLHSKELEIESAEIFNASLRERKKGIWAGKMSYNTKAETATLAFSKFLPKGKSQLKLIFKGVLNDKMRGFYRSSYTHQGHEKHLATTQFEATDARRAFPCFDEPAQKAVFEVSLIIPEFQSAISNTLPTEIKEHSGGYKIVKFAPTPKMSTYLLAMIVGDFEFVESIAKSHGKKTTVRVYTTPGKKHQAKFALNCSIKFLEFFNQYFSIPYPLNTLDLIAIPDFAHGAMENWGAITYRETALLIDEEHSAAANKQQVALTIAHELAHQWFGNLVTMEWWTHLWLNEGFASYIEYLAVDNLFPKWDIWTQFAYGDMGYALTLDAFKNTHPIEVEVGNPEEIGEIFDAISYSKGASVIRMLAAYLGERKFRDGLRFYLKKYSYKNAATKHLWMALEKISGKPVAKIMRNWVSRPGYPVLKIVDDGKKLKIFQSRFYSSAVSKKQSKDKTIWEVPITSRDSNYHQPTTTLSRPSATLPQRGREGRQWLKINSNETGFYRVAYGPKMLESLAEPIKNKKLSSIERWGIIRDAFALAEAGEIPTSDALGLAGKYQKEDDYTVWVELVSGLDAIAQLIYKEKIYGEFKKFALNTFAGILSNTNWTINAKDAHTKALLRSLILNAAGRFGDAAAIKIAKQKFKHLLSTGKHIHPDLRSAVYNTVAENGGEDEFKKLHFLHNQANLQEEQRRLARAMANFKSKNEIVKYLKFVLSRHVRAQDAPLFLAVSLANPNARDLTWKFIKQNWNILLQRYGHGGHLLSRVIQPLWHYSTEEKAKEIEKFFRTHPAPGCQRTIAQILEKIRSNEAWLRRDLRNIENFLHGA